MNCTRDDRCRNRRVAIMRVRRVQPGLHPFRKWPCNVEGICRRWWSPRSTGRRNISYTTCVDPSPLSFGLHLCPLTLFLLLFVHLFPCSSPAVTHTYIHLMQCWTITDRLPIHRLSLCERRNAVTVNCFSWNFYYRETNLTLRKVFDICDHNSIK